MQDQDKIVRNIDMHLRKLSSKQLRLILSMAHMLTVAQNQHSMAERQKQQLFAKGGKKMSREEMISGILEMLESASDLVVEQVFWETQEACG